jgi:phosphate transport system protein
MHMYEHTLKAFDTDIAGIRQAVVEMGSLAKRQFERALQAVRGTDPGLAAQVLADERVLNALHVRIDELCNRIIALRQPIAVDLREVIGTIHTVNDLERIGDEAKKIALKSVAIDPEHFVDLMPRIDDMAAQAGAMLDRAIDAFVRHDTTVAVALGACDDKVDELRDRLIEALVARMGTDRARVAQALDLVLIVQSIERVADHSENVAEYVVNVVEGVDMRHGNLPG